MKIRVLACMLIGMSVSFANAVAPAKMTTKNIAYQHYVEKHYKTAIRLQKKYKIPASIILAQGLLESGAGKSYLALGGNNHFGIKCSNWKGLNIRKKDDGLNDCFRKYLDVNDSYEDHSRFLSERAHYKPLFKLNITDYKGWADGLLRCGYATDASYGAKLVRLIEEYDLYYYDTAKESDLPKVVSPASDKPPLSATKPVEQADAPAKQKIEAKAINSSPQTFSTKK